VFPSVKSRHALRLAEGISEIAAFPACHPRYGEAFGLAVVAEKEHDRAGIVRDLTRRIDPLWICAGINFVDSLPRNDVGKILRGRLAESVAHECMPKFRE